MRISDWSSDVCSSDLQPSLSSPRSGGRIFCGWGFMKFFGVKAARESARPVLARAWGSGGVALGEWPASYEAQVRAGVVGNPVAQRALRLVAAGAGGTALIVGGVGEDERRGAEARVKGGS